MSDPIPSATSQPADDSNRRVLIGIGIGIVAGVVFGGWFPAAARSVDLIGDIFLNLLMMLVIPLVVLSMIVGIAALGDVRRVGAIGWRTVAYYLLTTGVAVAIGVLAVNVIRPGDGISPGESHPNAEYVVQDDGHTVSMTSEAWARSGYDDRFIAVLGDQELEGRVSSTTEDSVVVALWEHRRSTARFYVTASDGTQLPFTRVEGALVSEEPAVLPAGRGVEIRLPVPATSQRANTSGPVAVMRQILLGDPDEGRQGLVPRNPFAAMARFEILPLIAFSLLMGAALSTLGDRARPTLRVLETLNEAVTQLVRWVMRIAPLGIFGLIAARIGHAGGFAGFVPELLALGRYTATVFVGLAVHGIVVLPLILWLIARRRPGTYVRGVAPALLSALSTSSSSATLPLTIDGVQRHNGVSARTASFVLPLGATINMDGTALYEAVAAIFIAQVYGVDLSPSMQAIIVLTATLAAIGAAGIPEAGLVTMLVVLRAVGLPLEGVGLLLAVDWLLDRARTTVNVWGDSVGAAVVERLMPPAKTSSPEPAPVGLDSGE